ncbi:MAG: TonB-dependent receptor, partial [Caldithrix sp.]|nr:TonB-dependent receptor [Caldithrix sp.]
MNKKFLPLILFLVFTCSSLYAGVTGKIAGVVTDKTTGEPLPGVNIIIDGTTMGASTDESGYYVILNVPPGTYTLKAMYVGYTNVIVEEVKVSVDLTTRMNFEMGQTTLE